MKILKEIYNKHIVTMDQISKEFIEELKKDSKTNRDVYNKLNSFEKELLWDNGKCVDKEFISHIIGLLEKEMNDSLICETEDLKEAAREVSVQEQPDNLYPTKVTLVDAIGNNGFYCIDGDIYNSSNAITINILIDNTKYAKKDVYKSIKKVCDKLLQYFY